MSIATGLHCHGRLVSLLDQSEVINHPQPVPSAKSLKTVSLGFEQLLADYYWLKLISYVGDIGLQRRDRLAKAEQIIELVTEIDPHFVSAYWFAAFIIGGDMRNPKRAGEILDWGIQKNSDNWYLPFIAGVNQYLYAGNETEAAKYYKIASKYPGAPAWLRRQAQILDTNSPRLIKQAISWLNILRSANSDAIKEHARKQCRWLWVKVYKTAPNDAYREREYR